LVKPARLVLGGKGRRNLKDGFGVAYGFMLGSDMNNPRLTAQSLLEQLEGNRDANFWLFQIVGWGGLCIVTFLSLTVWYGTPNWSHVSHTIAQGLMGMGLCVGLRNVFKRIWNLRISIQLFIVLGAVIITSGLWTVMRMQAFLWLGQEYDIWKDFGGWYFGSFMVFLSWSAFYYGIKFYQLLQEERESRSLATLQIKEEQLMRLSAESGVRDAQMKMLRYQLNPHFLFNTLNSISALVRTNRTEQARSMITQLSQFLRSSLDGETAIYVTLSEEIETLQSYLNIEKVRYGDRLRTEFSIDPKAEPALLPCLILQPLLENALQYAIAGKVKGGLLRITAHVDGERLKIFVADSGDFDKSLLEGLKKGIGLSNIEARLASHYGKEGFVSYVQSDLGGLGVHLTLPFQIEGAEPSALKERADI